MTDIKPNVKVTDLPDASPSDPLEALGWLGDTVEEVVEGLRARGIKGATLNPHACPLHNYLAEFGWDYAVAGSMIRDRQTLNARWTITKRVLGDFVREFDEGKHPELIQP